MSKFKKPNIKASIDRSIFDSVTIHTKTINKREFRGEDPEFKALNNFSLKSIKIDDENFTNFICENKMYQIEDNDDIYDDVDKLVSVSKRYLYKLRDSKFKCLYGENSEPVETSRFKSSRDKRFERLLQEINPEVVNDYESGVLYKFRPKEINSRENTGIRVYFVFRINDEDKENIEYYHSIAFIDLYHLAIPSGYKKLNHDEYKEKYYNAINHSNIDLEEFFIKNTPLSL
ncbi:hypothetical protein ACEN33_03245 [Ruoffia sp. FAM 24228]|uniref:hypothetical protein n=1 Tax=Ruoffia sp. FAM 24228 TaxID=3259517 RepID=UPI0038898B61